MKICSFFMIILIGICLIGNACLRGPLADVPQIDDKSQLDNVVLDVLQELTPLPKPLFAWGVSYFQNMDFLDEWVRITHTCPITLAWSFDEQIRACAEMLVRYPDAKLSMTYSPMLKYYNVFRKSSTIGPTEKKDGIKSVTLDTAGSGGVWDKEMSLVVRRLSHISSIFHEFDIDLVLFTRSIAMLDHEHSVINDETIDVLTEKLNWMYDKFESYGHRTFYYNYRSQRPDSRSSTGWSTGNPVPEAVRSRWASCSMYWPSQVYMNREILKHTVDYNTDMEVVTFITLGWEWEYKVNQATGKMPRVANIEYDTGLSFVLGMDLNMAWRPQPNGKVPFVFCWPGVGHNAFFWKHFVSYVNGATFRTNK